MADRAMPESERPLGQASKRKPANSNDRTYETKEKEEMMNSKLRTMDLTVTRTIAAAPADVFGVWLDSKSPGSPWFGVAKAIVNPAVDGLFFHAVHHEGRDWAHYGRFIALDRPRQIRHTWVSEATRGLESIVTLTLEAQGEQTLVTLHHTNVPDDEMGRSHEEGWGFVLGGLADRFSPARAAKR